MGFLPNVLSFAVILLIGGDSAAQSNIQECSDHYISGSITNGVYTIFPVGAPSPVEVYCDMEDGGWTHFQRREDGMLDFYQDWNSYKTGFGNVNQEHWLGNENLYYLTNQRPVRLMIELELFNGSRYQALYSSFRVGAESTQYRLSVSGYSGDAGDSLSVHSNQQFFTRDRDDPYNCSKGYRGAWWFKACFNSHLNAQYWWGQKCPYNQTAMCISWFHLQNNLYTPFRKVTMKLQAINATEPAQKNINSPVINFVMDGVFRSIDNSSFDELCADEYSLQIGDKSDYVVADVNQLIGSAMCAGSPRMLLINAGVSVTSTGQQGSVTLAYQQRSDRSASVAQSEACVHVLASYVKRHSNWLQPIIGEIPGCPWVEFKNQDFVVQQIAWDGDLST